MTTANLTSAGSTPALAANSTTAGGAGTNTAAIDVTTNGDRNCIVANNSNHAGYPAIFARNSDNADSGSFGIYAQAGRPRSGASQTGAPTLPARESGFSASRRATTVEGSSAMAAGVATR